ncbi:MAG: 4Fe-4S binding protein, partial [Clostridiaceae bacterium]|nr:4Fe-4S binding protein [Clostridiaceae bacterium]
AYNDFTIFGEPMRFSSFSHVRSLCEKYGKPSDCIECGACVSICPQHLPIMELLKTISETMEPKDE